jgi:hypothetical protein
LTTTAPAVADDKEACIQEHAAGQRQRRAGALRAAHDTFMSCARDGCPAVVRAECTEWLEEVDASQPTVVVSVRDPDGNEIRSARVLVDGALLTDHLAGLALSVDPGEHVFRVVTPEGRAADQRILLQEGEKLRRITIELPGARSSRGGPPTPRDRGLPAAVYPLGALALAGLAGFVTLGVIAKSKADGFDGCKPACDASDVATMRREALFADISLGVGLVSIGAVVWILVTRGPSHLGASFSYVRGLGNP